MSTNQVNRDKILIKDSDIFEHLTGLLPIAVYATDINGIIVYYNEQAAKLWGRKPKLNDPDEVRYCGSHKIFNADGAALTHEECPMARSLLSKKCVKNEEIIIERPDASRINVLVQIDPIYNSDNEMIGAVNVLFDVTDRKKIERDVYHLAAIVESSDDAIVGKSLQGYINSWNKGAERIFGYSREEVIGKHITILIPPERLSEENVIINKIRNGEKVDHFETIRVTKDGVRLNISLTVSPIMNSAGKVIGASKIARDVTESVKIQEKLRKYNEELKRLNQYKDEFIASASHELKTPLTVVKAHLELLQEMMEEDNQMYISKTLINLDKLTALINDMLDVTRIQAGKMELNYSQFLLDDLIKDCIDSMKIVSPAITFHYSSSHPNLIISADSSRIEQVIINLLNNAIKYSPGKKDVFIRSEKRDGNALVEVTDNGIGIPQAQLKHIFNRFYRMKGLSENIAGLGIGLFIAQQIVLRHKGEIWVKESIEGEGSTFCFTIPTQLS